MQDRVYQGDVERISYDRSRSRASRVVPNALLSGITAKVPNNQEIRIEAHLVDDLQFVIQPLLDNWVILTRTIAALEALLAQLAKVGLRNVTGRDVELWQVIPLETQVDCAAFGDQQGVVDSLRNGCKNRGHLFRAAQVVSVVAHAHPVGVRENATGLDRQQDILQAGVGRVNVVHIVSRDETRLVPLAQVEQSFVDLI